MITTMCIAFFGIHQGSIATGELSLVYMIIYLLYLVNGPGKYSIDHLISRCLLYTSDAADDIALV